MPPCDAPCFCSPCCPAAARAARSRGLVWGKKGVRDGDLARPRAAVIDREGRLWIVDFTARVQAFSLDGKHLGITFQTPDYRQGRPSGLSLDRHGNLVVADSHYHCFRVYDRQGKEKRRIGLPAGGAPGQLGYVCDAVQDEDGFWYVAEFGEAQRITKLDEQGRFVASWGKEGDGPGEFRRLRALALGPDGLLYAADACNHRVQVLTRQGVPVRSFGGMSYPYDLAFGPDGSLYVAEYGSHKVSKWTKEGEKLGSVGRAGPRAGPDALPVGAGGGRQRPGARAGHGEPPRAAVRVLRREQALAIYRTPRKTKGASSSAPRPMPPSQGEKKKPSPTTPRATGSRDRANKDSSDWARFQRSSSSCGAMRQSGSRRRSSSAPTKTPSMRSEETVQQSMGPRTARSVRSSLETVASCTMADRPKPTRIEETVLRLPRMSST